MDQRDSYDDLPYESVAFSDTHPDYLYAIGRVFGLKPPPPQRCRVLEIGAASGGNLIPMAYYNPTNEYVGIELSEVQTRQAQNLIEQLGLSNVRIEQMDVLGVDQQFGEFDYIIAHGIYSWVPATVQQKILSLCAQQLTPSGIAYISYNVKPGWHIRNITRDCLNYAAKSHSNPKQKLADAQRMLDFLVRGLSKFDSTAARWFHADIERLQSANASYLYHEYLETFNEPILFTEFVDRIQRHGLQYIADTDLISMFPSALGPDVEGLFESIEGLIEQEQHADFLRLRPFRQSIICRNEVALTRDIDLNVLDEFFIVANLRGKQPPNLKKVVSQNYYSQSNREFYVTHPITKIALQILSDIYPNGVRTLDLFERAIQNLANRDQSNDDTVKEIARQELFNLWLAHGVHLSALPSEYYHAVSTRPLAHPLAHLQAELGAATSPRHQDLGLDYFSKQLLKLCDGQHTSAEIVIELMKRWQVDSEIRTIIDAGNNESKAKERVVRNVFPLLERFAKHGLFIANDK